MLLRSRAPRVLIFLAWRRSDCAVVHVADSRIIPSARSDLGLASSEVGWREQQSKLAAACVPAHRGKTFTTLCWNVAGLRAQLKNGPEILKSAPPLRDP